MTPLDWFGLGLCAGILCMVIGVWAMMKLLK